MRKSVWLRYSLASLIAASAVASGLLVACSSDDDTNNGTITPDSGGGNDSGTGNETSTETDGGSDADAAPPKVPAKLYIVHGATSLGDTDKSGTVRVCFATAPAATPNDFSVTPFPVLPHSIPTGGTQPIPGILQGTGGPFPASGADYEGLAIRPYIMNAERLAQRGIIGNDPATPRCSQIFGTTFDAGALPFEENKDYWQLPPIPAGTLKANHSYLLAVTGCTLDAPEGTLGCGQGDDDSEFHPTGAETPGVGNLKLSVIEIDTSDVAADEFGAQFIHAAPGYAFAAANEAVPDLIPVVGSPDDAGVQYVAGETAVAYKRNATVASALVKLKNVDTTKAFLAANPSGTGDKPFIPLPLNNTGKVSDTYPPIQYLSTGSIEATPLFVNGKGYTFVAVGTPGATGLGAFHFLGFPNVFTPPALQ